MKKNLFLLLLLINSSVFFAQKQTKLILNFPMLDLPFSVSAAKTVSNSVYPDFNVKSIDYLKAYANPSMLQSLNISASFYNVMNWGLSKMKINLFKKPFLNHLSQSIIFSGVMLVSEYIPLGDSWLHEEFHRAILTKNYINSYDEVNDFPFLAELVSVNNVTDENLIRLKKNNPVDFIRLSAAGIEGENMLIRELQKKSFFFDQQFPYFSYELLWTANSFFYVWTCHTNDAELTTDEVNAKEGSNVKIRDFTGLDFTAWVYDLFKPFEDYRQRGVHPSGIGIDRYIKPSDLTSDELSYLKKQGYLQLINFASPMLFGFNHFPLSVKGYNFDVNFAFRQLLTSFGNNISLDLLFRYKKLNFYNSIHIYSNAYKHFPGIETSLLDYDIDFAKSKVKISSRAMLWLQPENLLFFDTKGKIGGLFELTLKYGKKSFFPYIKFGIKSQGWVAGNEFQSKNSYLDFGISWYIK